MGGVSGLDEQLPEHFSGKLVPIRAGRDAANQAAGLGRRCRYQWCLPFQPLVEVIENFAQPALDGQELIRFQKLKPVIVFRSGDDGNEHLIKK